MVGLGDSVGHEETDTARWAKDEVGARCALEANVSELLAWTDWAAVYRFWSRSCARLPPTPPPTAAPTIVPRKSATRPAKAISSGRRALDDLCKDRASLAHPAPRASCLPRTLLVHHGNPSLGK